MEGLERVFLICAGFLAPSVIRPAQLDVSCAAQAMLARNPGARASASSEDSRVLARRRGRVLDSALRARRLSLQRPGARGRDPSKRWTARSRWLRGRWDAPLLERNR